MSICIYGKKKIKFIVDDRLHHHHHEQMNIVKKLTVKIFEMVKPYDANTPRTFNKNKKQINKTSDINNTARQVSRLAVLHDACVSVCFCFSHFDFSLFFAKSFNFFLSFSFGEHLSACVCASRTNFPHLMAIFMIVVINR